MPERGATASSTERAQPPLSKHEFLLSLSDLLRPLADPVAVVRGACHLLGEYLRADRAYYVELDEVTGVARIEQDWVRDGEFSLAGEHRIDDFGWSVAPLRRGDGYSIPDTQISDVVPADQRAAAATLGITGSMGAPLIKDGQLVGALCVTTNRPRAWTAGEAELLREVGERIWAAIERARAEHALRVSEEKYRTLFNSMDEGFCTIEMLFDERGTPVDYRYLDMNPAFVRQTGLDGVIGRTVREFAPNHEPYWYELYGQIAMTGEARRVEHEAIAFGRFYDVFAFRVGRPEDRHVAVIFNDITERKRAEATIQDLNRTLEQRVNERTRELTEERAALQASNEELEAFNYSVSHDLMTPLRHIAGFSELAVKHLDDPARARRYLDIIAQGAERMRTLIDAMLTLSRTGRRELDMGTVHLGELTEQARLDVLPQVEGRSIEWRIGPLPVVQGDRLTLQQVMVNLLGNAVKYSQGCTPAVIEVWAEEDARQWTVAVRDNGAGFDPAYGSKLFGIFQRLHRQDEFAGTGVGLSLVRRIIVRHGGTVSATGSVGQGATFRFTLPKSVHDAEAAVLRD